MIRNLLDRLLDNIANKLYSRAVNNGLELGMEAEKCSWVNTQELYCNRIHKLEEELQSVKQAYYQAQTECRRLSLLVSPETKEEFDKVVRDRSSFLIQNERLKETNRQLSIENDELREELLSLQLGENTDEN